MASEDALSVAFIIAVFLANFPEALSGLITDSLTDSLTYSVPLFLIRQCDRTLGPLVE
jgi:hypothetical protein